MKQKTIRKIVFRLIVIFLAVSLNWLVFLAVIQAGAFFDDREFGEKSVFTASSLDFSLPTTDDFAPVITPYQPSERGIKVSNDGDLDMYYDIYLIGDSNVLCSWLNLEVSRSGQIIYSGALLDFQLYNLYLASSSEEMLEFKAKLANSDYELQNKECAFDLVLDGVQAEGAGFSDTETAAGVILSGEWENSADYMVINKVYYDVDSEHGREDKNEWIELYNPSGDEINLKNWQICNWTKCEIINPNAFIPADGYALISHDSSTWKYWDIPGTVRLLNQLGGQFEMNNDNDMLILKDPDGNIIDQMNWGVPDQGWPNYNAACWDTGVADAEEGHALGRAPSGYDTDQASDFEDLSLPEIELTYPAGGEIWYVGRTYNITWQASSTNDSADSELLISLYYSHNSGRSWGVIATSTENDGLYEWQVPLFLEGGGYYVPSDKARIKALAVGPENFMIQAWDMSEDFCPPVDCESLFADELETARILGLCAIPDANDASTGQDGASIIIGTTISGNSINFSEDNSGEEGVYTDNSSQAEEDVDSEEAEEDGIENNIEDVGNGLPVDMEPESDVGQGEAASGADTDSAQDDAAVEAEDDVDSGEAADLKADKTIETEVDENSEPASEPEQENNGN